MGNTIDGLEADLRLRLIAQIESIEKILSLLLRGVRIGEGWFHVA